MGPELDLRALPRTTASGRSRLARANGWLVVGLAALAALAIGTVHAETRLVVCVGAAGALALAIVDRARRDRSLLVAPAAVALLCAAVATGLQLVPLPSGLLATLSPATDELLQTTLGEYGAHPLSLDPQATLIELAKLAGYLAFFVAAVAAANQSQGRRRILVAVAALASAIALLALVEQAVGTGRVLFVYTPTDDWGGTFRGSFVNPNHFAALMALAAPCALALGLTERRLRVPSLVALVVINGAAVLSFSRSALVFLPLGQVLTLVLDRHLLRAGPPAPERSALGWRFAGVIAAALALAFFLGLDALLFRLARTRVELAAPFAEAFSKFHQWPNVTRLLADFPLAGIGRGAFEPVFTRYSDQGGLIRYSHVENEYLQAAVDWGLPVFLALGFLAWRTLGTAWRRLRRDPQCVGAFAGVVCLALHEAVDFSTQLPGVALPALALLATLSGSRSADVDPAVWRLRARPWLLVAPVAVLALAVVAFPALPASRAGAAFAPLARDATVPAAAVVTEGERLRAEHPADYLIQAVVAERLVREGRPEAMRWLNGAIYLNPTHPAPHVLAADLLARAGRKDQALLEYRLALAVTTNPGPIWTRAALRYPALADLMAITLPDPALGLKLGDWLVIARRLDDGEQVYAEALARAPDDPTLRSRMVKSALERSLPVVAAVRARSLLEVDGGREARHLAARAFLAAGLLADAGRALDGIAAREHETFLLQLAVAEAHIRAGQLGAARARLDALAGARETALVVRWHEVRAALERRAGNDHQERFELEQAAWLRGR